MDAGFEAGFDTVVEIADDRGAPARVGRREHVLRVEWPRDRAAEFDAEGRLIVAQIEGTSWRRTLDQRLVGTRVRGQGQARRLGRIPEARDALDALARWHARVARLDPTSFQRQRGESAADLQELFELLRRAAAWDPERLAADRDAIRRLYRPIPVLPPDQYASLVLQATEGCPWDRCTFCDFYRGVEHRIREPEEFRAHVDAVLEHLGRSVPRFRRVFLGQANALLAPNSRLEPMLETVLERLPLSRDRSRPGIEGFHAFIDGFHRPKSTGDLVALRERGLRRVYLGLESGSERIVASLGKPSRNDAIRALARSLHDAGVGLGIIVLVGAGGAAGEAEHVARTEALVRDLELVRGDQVYLSPLVPQEGRALVADLDAAALGRQYATLRAGLREHVGAGVPIAPYDIERLARTSPRL